jgi:hypothetical protein
VRSSPERRRLRFSFHINNVKDPEPKLPEPPLGRTIRLAPDVGGGGYLSNLEFRVKPFFNKTVRTNPPNQPEGKSSRPWRPSREERQSSQEESFRKLFLDLKNNFRCSRELSSVTPGRAVSSKTNQPCQPAFSLSSMSWPRPFEGQKRGDEALEDRVFANSSPSRLKLRKLAIHLSKCKARRPRIRSAGVGPEARAVFSHRPRESQPQKRPDQPHTSLCLCADL